MLDFLTRGDQRRLHRFATTSTVVAAIVAACAVLVAGLSNPALANFLCRLWRWWTVEQPGELALLLQGHRVRLVQPVSTDALAFRLANWMALVLLVFLLVSDRAFRRCFSFITAVHSCRFVECRGVRGRARACVGPRSAQRTRTPATYERSASPNLAPKRPPLLSPLAGA